MNILPKKSWHVLSRDNVKKVRKDEADAREKEKELARKAALAEQEARIDFMRKRSREDNSQSLDEPTKRRKADEVAPVTTSEGQHINFFSDLQTGIGLEGAVNKDHEKEKKAEQEKWEKKVGILNYLVDKDSSSDPWYLKKRPEDKSFEKRTIADPLEEMKGHLETKKNLSATVTRPPSLTCAPSKPTSTQEPQKPAVYGKEIPKTHEHKKKKKKRDKEEKKMLLQKLREDRKRREEGERIKAEKLMKRHYGLEEKEVVSKPIEELPGRYNSQYNPHLARNKFK